MPYINKESVVMDIGCGPHVQLLKEISGQIKEGIGIDPNVPNNIEGNIKTKTFFLEKNINQESGSVNVVTAMAILEHLDDPLSISKEIYRILKPGGVYLITTPTWIAKPILEFLSFKLHLVDEPSLREHKRYFWKDELKEILIKSGFRKSNIKLKYFEFGCNLFAVAKKQ